MPVFDPVIYKKDAEPACNVLKQCALCLTPSKTAMRCNSFCFETGQQCNMPIKHILVSLKMHSRIFGLGFCNLHLNSGKASFNKVVDVSDIRLLKASYEKRLPTSFPYLKEPTDQVRKVSFAYFAVDVDEDESATEIFTPTGYRFIARVSKDSSNAKVMLMIDLNTNLVVKQTITIQFILTPNRVSIRAAEFAFFKPGDERFVLYVVSIRCLSLSIKCP